MLVIGNRNSPKIMAMTRLMEVIIVAKKKKIVTILYSVDKSLRMKLNGSQCHWSDNRGKRHDQKNIHHGFGLRDVGRESDGHADLNFIHYCRQ